MSRQRFRHAAPRRRLHPLIVTAIALAVLLVLLLLAIHIGGHSTPPAPAPTGPSVPAGTSGARQDGAAGVVPASPPAGLVWPSDLTWVTVAGLDLPVSAQAGPYELAGGLARGFAHTQAGAVLAALHLVVRASPQVGPGVWGPTLRTQVIGPDAEAYTDAVGRDYAATRQRLQIPYGQPLGRIYASIGGVRVDAYTAQAASLRLLVEAPDGHGGTVRAATVVQVSWSGSDWQLIAPPRGDWASVRTPVPPNAVGDYPPLPGR